MVISYSGWLVFSLLEPIRTRLTLKVHKRKNFLGSDFEIITFLWLIFVNYYCFVKKNSIWPLFRDVPYDQSTYTE
jgi:hypothetical protein